MRISNKVRFILIILFIILNIILRFQATQHEIGFDSFEMHVMANSLSEFGYAKWVNHPLSLAGLYPASYTSSLQFLLSGVSQSIGIDMEPTIFLYGILVGILSIFTVYLMSKELSDNELFNLLVAFGFPITPAILGYTTWTMTTRSLLIILAPLLIYLLLKCRKSVKYIPLTIIFTLFLFVTHHLIYFLIPSIIIFVVLIIYFKFQKYTPSINMHKELRFFLIISAFILAFSIPFFTGKFIENSRYDSFIVSYIRYVGLLIIPAIGGLGYLVCKYEKSFGEWFLLFTILSLTIFIYEQTYMKAFIAVFLIPLAGIGLINIFLVTYERKYLRHIIVILLLLSLTFSGYYQFLHDYKYDRSLEESTYKTGIWMKDYVNGTSTSNNRLDAMRIFSISDKKKVLTDSTIISSIYGFISIDMSDFKRYPLTSEDFYFSGYDGPDIGQDTWEAVNLLWQSPNFSIKYFVESTDANGYLIWNHRPVPSLLLRKAYDNSNAVYHSGKSKIWTLDFTSTI